MCIVVAAATVGLGQLPEVTSLAELGFPNGSEQSARISEVCNAVARPAIGPHSILV